MNNKNEIIEEIVALKLAEPWNPRIKQLQRLLDDKRDGEVDGSS
jgi:hypothetical protein